MKTPVRGGRSDPTPSEASAEVEALRDSEAPLPSPNDQQAPGGLPDGAGTTYHEILDNVADGVYFADRERRITFWNRAATEISGHPRESVVGRQCLQGPLQHVDMEGRRLCQTAACPLSFVLADGQPRQADVLLRHRDGHRVPVRVSVRPIRSRAGDVIGAVETFTDLTALLAVERRAAELERLAFIDALTGLGNRQFGERQLESSLAELDRHDRPFGLLLLDVDHFKAVNDTWGHDTGDAVLRAIGRTLSGAARTEDFVARWGGEEFLALVRESEVTGLTSAGERIRRMVAAAIVSIPGSEISVTVSIGGTIARAAETATQLLRRADALLYRSKERGRNQVTVSQ
jgi:diguanylate cyclase (GGDEF)-like protein/PAS domain S-box-containing protein